MLFRIMLRSDASAAVCAHFFAEVRAVKQESDGVSKLIAIAGRIEQPRHAMLNQLGP